MNFKLYMLCLDMLKRHDVTRFPKEAFRIKCGWMGASRAKLVKVAAPLTMRFAAKTKTESISTDSR